jgi:uncharacterized membrane protein YGL010W
MRSMTEQLLGYAAYHKSFWNKVTHFFGVPLVVFSIFVPLGWFRFAPVDVQAVPLTGATVFYASVFLYYCRLDWVVAVFQAPLTIAILYLADVTSRLPFLESLGIFGAAFVSGWIIQLVGHVFEGRRPALADNILQIFNAPLFLTVEVLFFLGFRKELAARVKALP